MYDCKMEFMLLVCCFTIYFAPFPSIIRPPMGFEFDKLACRQFSLFFCSSVITFGLWIYAFSQRGSGAGQSLVTQLIIVLHLTQDAVPESGASFRSQKLQIRIDFVLLRTRLTACYRKSATESCTANLSAAHHDAQQKAGRLWHFVKSKMNENEKFHFDPGDAIDLRFPIE